VACCCSQWRSSCSGCGQWLSRPSIVAICSASLCSWVFATCLTGGLRQPTPWANKRCSVPASGCCDTALLDAGNRHRSWSLFLSTVSCIGSAGHWCCAQLGSCTEASTALRIGLQSTTGAVLLNGGEGWDLTHLSVLVCVCGEVGESRYHTRVAWLDMGGMCWVCERWSYA
jgi:hypothetical protein